MRVDAVPFDKSIEKLHYLLINNIIYEYDNPNKFCTVLIRINHSIYIKDMKRALLWPNQDHDYGTIFGNTPPHLDHMGTVTFTITSGDYNFPLEQYGITAYINLRRSLEEEPEYCPIVYITDEDKCAPYKDPTIFLLSIQH